MEYYVYIDGDDIGNRISDQFLSNNENGLRDLSVELEKTIGIISETLVSLGFEIIFCAADGTAAKTADLVSLESIEIAIRKKNRSDFTFSIGVGESLRESFIALLSAKSRGKNRLVLYSNLIKE